MINLPKTELTEVHGKQFIIAVYIALEYIRGKEEPFHHLEKDSPSFLSTQSASGLYLFMLISVEEETLKLRTGSTRQYLQAVCCEK
ncbi:CLUMA_CG005142, isoform A [Clunio marinus]|uniref:CLUMA_CG005142, isoform A n=1 Tax=Clunio marinus TaxID=568069 RepID=A0A1J1HU00_9DIPT|nr:CLUMA_CG005142, isoform A [Clunio marinus]